MKWLKLQRTKDQQATIRLLCHEMYVINAQYKHTIIRKCKIQYKIHFSGVKVQQDLLKCLPCSPPSCANNILKTLGTCIYSNTGANSVVNYVFINHRKWHYHKKHKCLMINLHEKYSVCHKSHFYKSNILLQVE